MESLDLYNVPAECLVLGNLFKNNVNMFPCDFQYFRAYMRQYMSFCCALSIPSVD